jgi:hypothetical protein
MHFYYLDEAGCTGNNLVSEQQPIFVLGGLSVRDEGWHKTQDDLQKILKDYFGGQIPNNFELHAEELLSPQGGGPFASHERLRRNELALKILYLIVTRRHDIHLFGIEKNKMARNNCGTQIYYDTKVPYLTAFDYLITYIHWFIKDKLGQSARGMIILDIKAQYQNEIDNIIHNRRYVVPKNQRLKWIVEFSYPIDSKRNPMIQLSDLVVFCAKKFFELEAGYREEWPIDAKNFYANCFKLIIERVRKKGIVNRNGRGMDQVDNYLESIQPSISRHWKRKYALAELP